MAPATGTPEFPLFGPRERPATTPAFPLFFDSVVTERIEGSEQPEAMEKVRRNEEARRSRAGQKERRAFGIVQDRQRKRWGGSHPTAPLSRQPLPVLRRQFGFQFFVTPRLPEPVRHGIRLPTDDSGNGGVEGRPWGSRSLVPRSTSS